MHAAQQRAWPPVLEKAGFRLVGAGDDELVGGSAMMVR
jgi:hypothetical protein